MCQGRYAAVPQIVTADIAPRPQLWFVRIECGNTKGRPSVLIYKIVDRPSWEAAAAVGSYNGSVHDIRDGFIHFSTAEQAPETAAKHFKGETDLLLVAVNAASIGTALRWEPSRGGALFPHLYAPLETAVAAWVKTLPLGPDGRHIFPFEGFA